MLSSDVGVCIECHHQLLGDACLESAMVKGSMATPHVKNLPRHFLSSSSPTNTVVCNTASPIDKNHCPFNLFPFHPQPHRPTPTLVFTPITPLTHSQLLLISIIIHHHDWPIHSRPPRCLNHPLQRPDLLVSFPPPRVDASPRSQLMSIPSPAVPMTPSPAPVEAMPTALPTL